MLDESQMMLLLPSKKSERSKWLFFSLLLISIACSFFDSIQPTAAWANTQKPYIIDDKTYQPIMSSDGFTQKGLASWYGSDFHGRKTSNGEQYNMHSLTAAHKTLPLGTVLLVKNLDNGKDTLVRVNDRGPFADGRIIDLSYKAARTLGIVDDGTAKVQIIALAEKELQNIDNAPAANSGDLALGEFYVQIGTFAKQFNAVRLQKRFIDAGHTAVIQKSFNAKDILYRVCVYVGKTLQSAKAAERKLLESGYVGAFVITQ